MDICPLAVEWGNFADWAAVVVGTGAAVGTIWVASVANRTSKRAAEIAEDAKTIAKQQSDQVLAQQHANAAILGRLLLHEISHLPARLSAMLVAIPKAVRVADGQVLIEDHQLLTAVLDDAKWSMVPQSESVLGRIHDLPDALGPDLATLIGNTGTTRDMAQRMISRVAESPRQYFGQQYRFVYNGMPDDFELLEEHLKFFKRLSIEYAKRFRTFVGIDEGSYSHLQ
ncbi:hypothetical protein ACI703_15750 [Isoptericola jiangsuensis]|uniref:hypothetical protein n=1 Tax=Isoptericola jiangsuensis TaxID=548579 RepID=UPI00386B3D76